MNAFFDGYVNPKTTLKQFVEQYDIALRNKVEKEKKADFKSRHKLFGCLTIYGFEKQFQQAYTNAKFKEVQGDLKRLVYYQAVIVKEEGSISTYNVQEAMVVCEKMKHVDFVVYFNSTECEVQCMCRFFEFRDIMCAHSLAVLVRRCINEVPSKYILPRWRKDVDREYACIKTTYTGFGNDFNVSTYERMNKKLIVIVQLAGNSEGKTRIIDLGLDEIKERVMKEESGDRSNLPCSTKVRFTPVLHKEATKLLRFEAQAQAQAKAKANATAYTPYYPYMVGTQNSMYVPVTHGIGGTSLTLSDFISGTQGSSMSAATQIYGSASLTPSASHACTPGSLDITDLFD
ncbi:protein FAR1-RELATED SEQUENCE 9-like [Camellia sinensis]|uniref:protein FAR1-RELATED SEQUENCE 9-like n=1 Tax=Camellia sinensis TaxID=4442 RepID=UPI001036C63A|nr:protein FAR1-RELATED SEQUENCE 9-like [Camellia sinensis]